MVSSNITTTGSYFVNNVAKSAKAGTSSATETFTSVMQKNTVSKSENNSSKNITNKSSEYNAEDKAVNTDAEDKVEANDSNEKIEDTINKFKEKTKKAKAETEVEASDIVSFYFKSDIEENIDIDVETVKEVLVGLLGIDTDKLDSYLDELNLSVEDLLNSENAMKLAMISKDVTEATELLVNHELAEEIKDFAEEIKTAVVSSVDEKVQDEAVVVDEAQENIVTSEHKEENDKADNSYGDAKNDNIEVQIQGETITDKLNQMDNSNQNSKNAFDEKNSKENEIISNFNVSGTGNIVDDITNAIVDTTEDVDQARIISQIIDGIKVNARPGITSMEMQLYPEHLGKVTIEVSSNNGVLNAKIAAETESARRAIEGQLTLLKDNLNNQGIKVESVEVTIAGHGFEENLENGNQRDNHPQHRNHHVRKSLMDEINGEESFDDITEEAKMEAIGNTVSYRA